MRRREFIAAFGCMAAVWPVAVHAQQDGRARRVGFLMGFDERDVEAQDWVSIFKQELVQLGWTDGRNTRMDVRWSGDRVDRIRLIAKELVGLRPDVILAGGTPATAALQRETRTIPIVFGVVSDPVGDGFVASLPRPGGNMTGFISQEAGMAGKWPADESMVTMRTQRLSGILNHGCYN